MAKASSANLGSCPLAVSVAVGHERRRADLLEGVGVAVEGELAQRPAERGAEAAGHREHRAADLDRPLVVEDAERRARLPVRDPLVVGERRPAGRCGPLTTGLSASDAPSGTSGWIRFGITSSSSRSARDSSSCSPRQRAARRRPAARLSAWRCLGAGRRRRPDAAAPTCLESSLTRARVSSRCGRQLAQLVVERGRLVELLEQRRVAAPRRRRACTPSGSVRSSRTSITRRSPTLRGRRSVGGAAVPTGASTGSARFAAAAGGRTPSPRRRRSAGPRRGRRSRPSASGGRGGSCARRGRSWRSAVNHSTTMIDHRKIEPPVFMIAPASCWSSVTDSPHTRTGLVVGLVDGALGERQPRRRHGRDHRLQEEVDHLAAGAHVQLAERAAHRHPHQQRGRRRPSRAASSAAPGSSLVTEAFTTPGMWVTITATLNSSPATTGLHNQRSDARRPRPFADEHPQQPLRRRQQGQRRQEVAQHHVLEHVDRVQVAARRCRGSASRWPPRACAIAAAKATHVAAGDDRLAGGDGVRPDRLDHVDVRRRSGTATSSQTSGWAWKRERIRHCSKSARSRWHPSAAGGDAPGETLRWRKHSDGWSRSTARRRWVRREAQRRRRAREREASNLVASRARRLRTEEVERGQGDAVHEDGQDEAECRT